MEPRILSKRLAALASEDQIILYSIGGMPVEDVAWGKEIYERALKMGIGVKLNLWDEPYLY